MPFFSATPDIKIFYTLHGSPSNPPILLIHGWTCDSQDWIFTIPALLPKYHVITLDLRGHGHSSAPESATYRPEDFASDAAALLQHLDLKQRATVIGHSMGGIVASVLTASYPALVDRLVVIDPPYNYSKDFWASALETYKSMGANVQMWAVSTYGPEIIPKDPPMWLLTLYAIRAAAVPEYVVTKCLEECFGPGMLGQSEVHREFVEGKREVPRLAVYLNEEMVAKERELGFDNERGDQVITVTGKGHWMHHIEPQEFNELLMKWLALTTL